MFGYEKSIRKTSIDVSVLSVISSPAGLMVLHVTYSFALKNIDLISSFFSRMTAHDD